MVVISCPDKFIIRNVQQFPEFLDPNCHTIYISLRTDTSLLCLGLNLLSMLIKTSQIENIVAHETLVASQNITSNGGIGRPDVEFTARIVDRGCNIKRLFFSHFLILSRLMKPFLIALHYIIFCRVCEKIVTYSKHK